MTGINKNRNGQHQDAWAPVLALWRFKLLISSLAGLCIGGFVCGSLWAATRLMITHSHRPSVCSTPRAPWSDGVMLTFMYVTTPTVQASRRQPLYQPAPQWLQRGARQDKVRCAQEAHTTPCNTAGRYIVTELPCGTTTDQVTPCRHLRRAPQKMLMPAPDHCVFLIKSTDFSSVIPAANAY
jgi:hypothetical protein